jgi:hypothetical protein
MKLYIGPYKNPITPYGIAKSICFWESSGITDEDTTADKLGEWLAISKDGGDSRLTKFCQWYNRKFMFDRKVKIKVHNYDSWNADQTMAMMIVPILKEIQDSKQGFSSVDDEDVPDVLRSDKAPPLTEDQINCDHYDELAPARWDWILSEMIWTFEQHANEDWEEQYYSGTSDLQFVGGTLVNGPNHTFKVDEEGRRKHVDRMLRGRMLFAKYYGGLWT